MNKKPLIILTGPTAVGKTALSISLAKAVDGEIISADSIQVYKYMDIGSAKIMPDEMQGIPHFLIDEFEPDEDFNIYIFQKKAKEYCEEIYSRGHIPIIVGGTGFYIQSLIYDIEFTKEDNNYDFRHKLESLAVQHGNKYIHDMLKSIDPESAEAIHANNLKRVIRALEYYHETGEKISVHNEREKYKESPYNFEYFVINNDRKILYDRIDNRIDNMIDNGLVQEVEMLKSKGYSRELTSMQGLGYKEIYSYLDGEMTLDEAIYILKRDTRHFAKRQLTWFKRERDIDFINYQDYDSDIDKMLSVMIDILKNKSII